MTTYDDNLVAVRFAVLAPEPQPGDWDDVLGRAGVARDGRPQPESSHGHRAHRRRRLGLIAVAAVILVGVLLVTPAFGLGSRLLDLIQSESRPPGVQGAPVWSPNGRSILYLRRHARGKWEITAVNADGSRERVLARNVNISATFGARPFALSLDGRKIAFASDRDGDGRPELYAMSDDGSGIQRLARPGYEPAWSPDGRQIAFVSSSAVYVMNADGSGHRRLAEDVGKASSLAWSPPGRELAYLASGEPFCFQVYVANADGSELRQLTSGSFSRTNRRPSCFGALAWSPDGLKFAFTRYRAPTFDTKVWVMNADGSGKRRLTRSVEQVRALAWSPDGRKILFAGEVVGFTNSGGEIYVMNADGSGRRNLTRNPAHDFAPAFSPDGRKIVFVSDRDGGFDVYVMNADGSGQRRLTHRGG